MNIALVDDSSIDRQFLFDNIERYCHDEKVHMQIKTFENGDDFLHTMSGNTYDLVFLDIYMGRQSGMEIAEAIRRTNRHCQIIFTTSSREHAIKAFRLHALDYLLKPYTYEELSDSLARCKSALSSFNHYIELKEGRHFTRVLISDIIYTDYYNHYIQVHTTERVLRSYMSFADFSPMLEPYAQFLWCYRNCMINMDYINSMDDKDFILKNGERIPISRARKNEIRQAYANYVFSYVTDRNTD